jgi:hypothetical protein
MAEPLRIAPSQLRLNECIANTKTQLEPKEFIRKLAPSCAGQLDVTSKSRSIAIGQNVPVRA